MLAGELEYRRGNFEVAFDHLRTAVAREDALHLDAPPGCVCVCACVLYRHLFATTYP